MTAASRIRPRAIGPTTRRAAPAGVVFSGHRDLDARGLGRRAVHAVRRRAEVPGRRLEDVRHERLRVAVDDREPRALDLDHDPVAALERVVLGVQANAYSRTEFAGIGSGFSKDLRYRPRKTSLETISSKPARPQSSG
jgi:hypothetical protein